VESHAMALIGCSRRQKRVVVIADHQMVQLIKNGAVLFTTEGHAPVENEPFFAGE
jgi:hypothetical protein